MGNTRLRSSYAFLEHQTQWLISEKHEMNKQVSANTTITLPPWIWAICVSPRCAGTASLSDGEEFVNTGWQSYHSDAGSHLLPLCWEANLEICRREGFRIPCFRQDLQIVFALVAVLGFTMGTVRSSGFRSDAQACSWLSESTGLCDRSAWN